MRLEELRKEYGGLPNPALCARIAMAWSRELARDLLGQSTQQPELLDWFVEITFSKPTDRDAETDRAIPVAVTETKQRIGKLAQTLATTSSLEGAQQTLEEWATELQASECLKSVRDPVHRQQIIQRAHIVGSMLLRAFESSSPEEALDSLSQPESEAPEVPTTPDEPQPAPTTDEGKHKLWWI